VKRKTHQRQRRYFMTTLVRSLCLITVAILLGTSWTTGTPPPSEDVLVFESAVTDDATQSAAICREPGINSEATIFPDLHGASQPPQFMEEFMLRQLPKRQAVVRSPGTDTSLGMSWEPTVAVDPNNQNIVAVSQFTTIQVSFDGGDDNFPESVTAPGVNRQGDPSIAFDDQGNLFITYLCAPGGGRDVCITGYTCDEMTNSCSLLGGTTWPVNVTAGAGQGGNNADKNWMAADSTSTSPYAGRLYVVWTDLSTNPWTVYSTYSTDQGANWSTAFQLSSADESQVWPSHVAVAPDGDVYTAWHSQTGFLDPSGQDVPDGVSGQIVFRRSDNGGVNFQTRTFPYNPGEADATYNVQHEANGVIPGFRSWLFGSLQPWILADPSQPGRVYVVAPDDPDDDVDTGDPSDIFIVISDDSGDTWSGPMRIDDGTAGNFEVMPTAAIDPITGAIAVSYYTNEAGDTDISGNFRLDLRVVNSLDGGATWLPSIDFNDGRFDAALSNACRFCGADNVANQACNNPIACPSPQTNRIGEYNGIAFGECTAYAVWADNGPNPPNDSVDTFFDRDPELGGDLTAPVISCPTDVQVGCLDSIDPVNTGSATAADECTLEPDVGFVDESQGGNCPPGQTLDTIERIWNATDKAGNIDTCTQTIDIVDPDPPVLTVPGPVTLECNDNGGIPGDDPQILAWLALATAEDVCSEATVTDDAPNFFPSGCLPDGNETEVEFTGTDACGTSTSETSTVTVVDSTPPELSCEVSIETLWPPNHKFTDVGLSILANDVCDDNPPEIEISVTSDEATASEKGAGGKRHCPDAIINANQSVHLRAERSGNGDGRVYQITVTATDSCGNTSMCQAEITVPKNMGPNGAAVDSGQSYDAAVCN
jgi:hypothetical protein